jgi:hypothetical protein
VEVNLNQDEPDPQRFRVLIVRKRWLLAMRK